MEHNYVKCDHCIQWDLNERHRRVCTACNNSQMIIDPKEILCNMCGGQQRHLGTINEQYPTGLENAKVTGGYNSYHLLDDSSYRFNFCEKCLRELFIKCKIKPQVNVLVDGETDNWDKDQEYYEFKVWKDTGGHHQAYLDRKCNVVKECPNRAEYTRLLGGEFTENCSCEEHKSIDWLGNTNTKFIPNVLKAFL